MAFVPDVEADQHCGDLLNDAGILKFSAVESANSWNFSRQFTYALSSVFIVAADDHVTIDRACSFEKVGGQIMKRGHNYHTFGHKFGRLLRCRPLPDSESAGRLTPDTGSQRDGGVNEYLAGAQCGFDVLQGFSVRFERNSESNDFGIGASEPVLGARYCFASPDFFR